MATTPYTGQPNNQNFFANPAGFPAPSSANFEFTVAQQDDVSITGGNRNDTVKLLANVSRFTVDAGLGEDSLLFDGQLFNSRLNSGDDNDSINAGALANPAPAGFLPLSVSVLNSTVDAGFGDDYVYLKGRIDATTASGAEGNDTILVATGGNDSVEILSNSSLFGGLGGDSIAIIGSESAQVIASTVMANGGDDTIAITGGSIENSSVAAGIGNDFIDVGVNAILNSTLDGQQGNDTLQVEAPLISRSQILSGQGDTGNVVEIVAEVIEQSLVRTQGNDDTIGLLGVGLDRGALVNSTVFSSSGSDLVQIDSFDIINSSINAGTGDDTVGLLSCDGSAFVDNSTVVSAGGNDSVVITASMYSALVSTGAGNDTVLIETSGDGSVRNSTIDAGSNNDSIAIYTDIINPSVILGGGANDTIDVLAREFIDRTLVDGGTGNDLIDIEIFTEFDPGTLIDSAVTGDNGDDIVAIKAGTVRNSGIAGGANNDLIEVAADDLLNSTVNGQSGDDSLVIVGKVAAGSYIWGGGSVSGSQFSDTIKVFGDSIADSKIDTSTGPIGNLIELEIVNSIIGSTVISNGGSDTIGIAMTGTPSVIGTTLIEAGNGDNTVSVLGSVGVDGLVIENSTLTSGSGNDSVEIQAQKILGSTVNLGDGENQLFVDMLDGTDNRINPSAFITGSGNDSVRIEGDRTVLEILDSTVSTGEGNDTVEITAKVLLSTLVDGGNGDNLVVLSADFIANSTVVTGTGNDTIATPQVGSLENSLVDAGAGDDLLALVGANLTNSTVKAGEGSDSLGLINSDLRNSLVDAGEGNNLVLINADPSLSPDFVVAAGDLNLENSTISSGAGNDTIEGLFNAISNSSVISTGGDDAVILDSLTSVTALGITTGSGADFVSLDANDTISGSLIDTGSEADTVSIGAWVTPILISGTTVTSGSGADLINLTAGTILLSSVEAGSENDTVTISTGAWTLINSTVTGNAGDDLINITGNVANSSVAGGSDTDEQGVNDRNDLINVDANGGFIRNSTFEGAFGNDSIFLIGEDQDDNLLRSTEGNNTFAISAQSLSNSSIIGGTGTDSVDVQATGSINTLLIQVGARNDTVGVFGNSITGLTVTTDDTPLATAGNDQVSVAAPALNEVTIRTLAGNDSINVIGSVTNALLVDAGAGNDSVYAGGALLSNSAISGGAGNDTVDVNYNGIVNSTIDGGFGSNDSITVTASALSNSSIDGLNGDDVVTVNASFAIVNSTIIGGTGKDTVTISGFPNIGGSLVDLGEDNDRLALNANEFLTSTLLGGSGNDSLDINVSNFGGAVTLVDAGSGNDTIDIRGVDELLRQTTVTASAGNDLVLIDGLKGLELPAVNSPSALLGGIGNDTLFIDGTGNTADFRETEVSEFEYYWLGAGNTLQVNAEAIARQTLAGFNSTFSVTAKDAAGNDADVDLSGMLLSSTWVPGSGSITITASSAGTGRVLNGHIQVSAPQFNGLADVLILGSAFDDTIIGSVGEDQVLANAGNDSVDGKGGADSLYGEAGNDTILGGLGNDSIFGGLNNDSILGGEGDDSLGYDVGSNTVLGGLGNDVLYGDELETLAQFLDGGSGTDRLFGASGNDSLVGGEDADYLVGFSGNDTINGDAGNDTLIGGKGADRLNAGAGTNRFVWETATTFANPGDSVNATAFNNDAFDLIYNAGDEWVFGDGVDIVTGASLSTDVFAVGIGSNSTGLNGGAGAGFKPLLGVAILDYPGETASSNFYINGEFVGTTFKAVAAGAQFTHTLISQGIQGTGALPGVFATKYSPAGTEKAANYTFLVDWQSTISSMPLTASNFVANIV